jgi:sensor histidine kinase YesM
MFNFQKSLKLSNSINDNISKINVLKNIASCQHNNGKLEASLATFRQAYNLALSNKDLINQANILSQIANYYSVKGDDTKALEIFTKALNILDKTSDNAAKADTKRLMILIYIKQKEYEVAEKLLKENHQFYISKSNELPKFIENNYNLSKIYLNTKKKNLFTKHSDIGLKLAHKTENFGALSNFYRLKRAFYTSEKKIDSVQKYTNLNFNLISKLKTEPDYSLAILDVSDMFKLKKQYAKAETFGLIAYKNLENIGLNNDLQRSSNNLKEIYKLQNRNKEALFYAEIELKIIDSLTKTNTQNSAIKSLFKYETEKKEATIKELNQKKKISELESNKKSLLINSIVISFLALTIIAYFLFSRFKTQKKNELLQTQLIETQKRLEAEKKATDSELKALKSQMNPHFIFNALNSIQEQFMYGDKLKGNEQLSNFTYLTRQILEVSGKKQITIATEIDILTKYLELEKMRFATDFEYSITTTDAIDEDYMKLPPMLIQPFVENSIKHGLMHKSGLKTIAIDFDLSSSEAYLICTIIDNGIGRQKSAEIKAGNLEKHNSFSTKSIQQRLELLNDNLHLQELILYSDVIENETIVGTEVTINIPLG